MAHIFKFVAATAAVLAFASPAVAQDVSERASAFASQVALSASDTQYARWSDGLCPSVAGLAAADAQTIIDHIARRAHQVGLDVAGAGCSRNLIIIFAPEGRAVAQELVTTRPDLLGFASALDIPPSLRPRLDAFVAQDRPVRYWHLSTTMGADGSSVSDGETRQGRGTRDALAASRGGGSDAVLAGNGLSNVEAMRADGTRFRSATREDITFAVVVVDTRQVAGQPPSAVADYVTMASLVQLDPAADLSSYPSILNLFSGAPGAAQASMTAWDMGYLEGLYRGNNRAAASLRQQRADIARRIQRAVANQ